MNSGTQNCVNNEDKLNTNIFLFYMQFMSLQFKLFEKGKKIKLIIFLN